MLCISDNLSIFALSQNKKKSKGIIMHKIVIIDGYTATQADLSWHEVEQLGEVTIYDRTSPDDVISRCKEADAVLTNKVVFSAEVMSRLPLLKYIGVLATGYNVVDIEEASRRGIVVTNIPAYSTQSVAQMVFAHILNVTNRVDHYATANRKSINGSPVSLQTPDTSAGHDADSQSRWARSIDFCWMDTPVTELDGKTLGIIGLGNIGSAVARIAHAFGMRVIASTSKGQSALPTYIEKVTLDMVFCQSDFLSLHCPLTDATRHLVCSDTISLMKPRAVIINTGRGPLVNEQDVADALQHGRLGAFCADVLSTEPPSADNPILSCPNAYITPHIAWASHEARSRLIRIAAQNLAAFYAASPINIVTC